MKKTLLAIAIALLAATTVASPALAGCMDGATAQCTASRPDGTTYQGTKECNNGRWSTCEPAGEEEPEPLPSNGTVTPKYIILAVLYAPPGSAGGQPVSSVEYATGSTYGTSTSISQSLKGGVSLSATASALKTEDGNVQLTGGYTLGASSGKSWDLKKALDTIIRVEGSKIRDGVNHDEDQIWFWANPTLNVVITPHSAALDLLPQSMVSPEYLLVAELKDPSIMNADKAHRLSSLGFTDATYREMLKADPCADGCTQDDLTQLVDSKRFKPLNYTFPYYPPLEVGGSTVTQGTKVSGSNTQSSTASTQQQVDLTLSGGTTFVMEFWKLIIGSRGTLTWTYSKTTGSSSGASQSAGFTLRQPSYGYEGPTLMVVYFDNLFNTFVFAPSSATPKLRGKVVDSSGQPVVGQEVEVFSGGNVYHAYTDVNGEYRVVSDEFSGPFRLQTGAVAFWDYDLPQTIVLQ